MENQPINKPDWLVNLEQESWQAELIISGLAILGALQLPGLIDRFGQWMMTCNFQTSSKVQLIYKNSIS